MWEEAWSIREITFREQELNWLFTKYKRLENNPLYGIWFNLRNNRQFKKQCLSLYIPRPIAISIEKEH